MDDRLTPYTIDLVVLDENGAQVFRYEASCFKGDVTEPGQTFPGMKKVAEHISNCVPE